MAFGWRLAVVVTVTLLASCVSSGENLERETARSIGGNIAPESVTVSNVDRGATSVKWDAQTPGGQYACSADDMVRRVYCVKK
jgi:hypothetical protein